MSDPTHLADEPPAPDDRPAPTGLLGIPALIALLGVLVAVAGLGLALVPVRTPTQDCGTPMAFLLRGRVDVLVDPVSPPTGITPAEAKANNARPCQQRSAARGLPALVLVLVGTTIGLIAATVEVTIRLRRRRSPEAWVRTSPPAGPAILDPRSPDTGDSAHG